jgi:hypothetical protein
LVLTPKGGDFASSNKREALQRKIWELQIEHQKEPGQGTQEPITIKTSTAEVTEIKPEQTEKEEDMLRHLIVEAISTYRELIDAGEKIEDAKSKAIQKINELAIGEYDHLAIPATEKFRIELEKESVVQPPEKLPIEVGDATNVEYQERNREMLASAVEQAVVVFNDEISNGRSIESAEGKALLEFGRLTSEITNTPEENQTALLELQKKLEKLKTTEIAKKTATGQEGIPPIADANSAEISPPEEGVPSVSPESPAVVGALPKPERADATEQAKRPEVQKEVEHHPGNPLLVKAVNRWWKETGGRDRDNLIELAKELGVNAAFYDFTNLNFRSFAEAGYYDFEQSYMNGGFLGTMNPDGTLSIILVAFSLLKDIRGGRLRLGYLFDGIENIPEGKSYPEKIRVERTCVLRKYSSLSSGKEIIGDRYKVVSKGSYGNAEQEEEEPGQQTSTMPNETKPEIPPERTHEKSESKPAPFVPTSEWQEVPKDAILPPGLEIRMNLETGKNEARTQPSSAPEQPVTTQKTPELSREDEEKLAQEIMEERGWKERDSENDSERRSSFTETQLQDLERDAIAAGYTPEEAAQIRHDSSISDGEYLYFRDEINERRAKQAEKRTTPEDAAVEARAIEAIATVENQEDVAKLPEKVKERLGLGFGNLGFLVEEYKNGFFASAFEKARGKLKAKSTVGRFVESLAENYRRDQEKAKKKFEDVKRGDKHRLSNAGYLVGNIVRYGRTVLDFFTGYTIASPLRYTMMGAMMFGRGAEAAKEARLKNEKVIEKTRTKKKDIKKAEEEAWKIYEKAEQKAGKGNVSKEALQKAFMEGLPQDLLSRLNGSSPEIKICIARKIVEGITVKWIGSSLNKIEKKLGKAKDEKEREKILSKYETKLKDLNRIIGEYGQIDLLAISGKLAESAAKGVVTAVSVETLLALPLEKIFDIKIWDSVSSVLGEENETGTGSHINGTEHESTPETSQRTQAPETSPKPQTSEPSSKPPVADAETKPPNSKTRPEPSTKPSATETPKSAERKTQEPRVKFIIEPLEQKKEFTNLILGDQDSIWTSTEDTFRLRARELGYDPKMHGDLSAWARKKTAEIINELSEKEYGGKGVPDVVHDNDKITIFIGEDGKPHLRFENASGIKADYLEKPDHTVETISDSDLKPESDNLPVEKGPGYKEPYDQHPEIDTVRKPFVETPIEETRAPKVIEPETKAPETPEQEIAPEKTPESVTGTPAEPEIKPPKIPDQELPPSAPQAQEPTPKETSWEDFSKEYSAVKPSQGHSIVREYITQEKFAGIRNKTGFTSPDKINVFANMFGGDWKDIKEDSLESTLKSFNSEIKSYTHDLLDGTLDRALEKIPQQIAPFPIEGKSGSLFYAESVGNGKWNLFTIGKNGDGFLVEETDGGFLGTKKTKFNINEIAKILGLR